MIVNGRLARQNLEPTRDVNHNELIIFNLFKKLCVIVQYSVRSNMRLCI